MSETNHEWNQPWVKLTMSETNHGETNHEWNQQWVKLPTSETNHEWN